MSITALRRRPGVASLDSAEARDRSVRRRVGAAWALLFFNTLTFVPGVSSCTYHPRSARGSRRARCRWRSWWR